MNKLKIIISITIIIFGTYVLIRDSNVYREILNKIIKSDFERSLEACNKSIKNNPNDPWNYSVRGQFFKKNKMYIQALKDYLKAYKLNNSFFFFLKDISNIHLALGNIKFSYRNMYEVIKKAPYPDKMAINLAFIFDNEWKSKQAIKHYTKTINFYKKNKNNKKYLFSLYRSIVHNFVLNNFKPSKSDLEYLISKPEYNKQVKELLKILLKNQKLNKKIFKQRFKLNVYKAITLDN